MAINPSVTETLAQSLTSVGMIIPLVRTEINHSGLPSVETRGARVSTKELYTTHPQALSRRTAPDFNTAAASAECTDRTYVHFRCRSAVHAQGEEGRIADAECDIYI